MMAVFEISSAYFAVAKTVVPGLDTNMAVIDEAMGRQLFQNFVKLYFISIIIFINMLNYI